MYKVYHKLKGLTHNIYQSARLIECNSPAFKIDFFELFEVNPRLEPNLFTCNIKMCSYKCLALFFTTRNTPKRQTGNFFTSLIM